MLIEWRVKDEVVDWRWRVCGCERLPRLGVWCLTGLNATSFRLMRINWVELCVDVRFDGGQKKVSSDCDERKRKEKECDSINDR